MPVGRPFVKGDPRANLGGPVSAKLRKLQKNLLTLAPTAFEQLKRGVESGNIEYLKLWARYTIPVPKPIDEIKVEDPYRKMTDAELVEAVRSFIVQHEALQ